MNYTVACAVLPHTSFTMICRRWIDRACARALCVESVAPCAARRFLFGFVCGACGGQWPLFVEIVRACGGQWPFFVEIVSLIAAGGGRFEVFLVVLRKADRRLPQCGTLDLPWPPVCGVPAAAPDRFRRRVHTGGADICFAKWRIRLCCSPRRRSTRKRRQ